MPSTRNRGRRAALLVLAVPCAALAQTVRLPEVIVTGNPLGSDLIDMVPPAAALSGDRLFRLQQPTLGEIVADLPGLTATYYGPNASRPVIRGLDGERVRILQNGLGTLDASGTSVDHAVALDPLSASRIEVVRGPATLLYGPSAIGGVVNVIDNRIPSEALDGVRGGVDLRYASPARERAVAGQIEAGPGGGLALHADVTDEASVERAVARATAELGAVEIVVNNAGIGSVAPIDEITRAEWDRTLDVNLTSMFVCTRAVLPGMIERRRGVFVNLASLAGKRGGGILGKLAYATSKAGVLGFTKCVARESAAHGIRANAVAPGAIDAGMAAVLGTDPELGSRVLPTIPLGRFGTGLDVARVVAFLASDDAGYLTGETIVVDGGIYMG